MSPGPVLQGLYGAGYLRPSKTQTLYLGRSLSPSSQKTDRRLFQRIRR